jgi:colanic acid/amylovoran biosynthesis glycosyltransferase
MKIGIVLSTPPSYSETFFKNKIQFLKDSGHEVYLFVDKSPNNYQKCYLGYSQGNGLIVDIKSKILVFLRIFSSPSKTINLFLRNKSDGFGLKKNIISIFISIHILSFQLDWLHFGFATMALYRENVARSIGAKMAVSIRGYDITIYPIKFPNCYDLVWKRIDKLHYISDGLLNLAIKNGFSINQEHIKITPAIDVTRFNYIDHLKSNILRITTIARLNWIKGIEYIVEALSYIKNQNIQFEYLIIGEGDDFERLKYAAYQFDIFKEVKFLGKKTQVEVIDILKTTDIYIQYSIQEGFGNSVLEAQAMGCICIVSDAEGLTENVLNNETGFVVKKRNPTLLFNKLIDVIHLDESIKKQMILRSLNRIKESFNLSTQAELFNKFYNE